MSLVARLLARLRGRTLVGGDEHGKLLWPRGDYYGGPPQMPLVGARLLLQPGHCDPTVNLYDYIVGVRKGVVEQVFCVDARGPGS